MIYVAVSKSQETYHVTNLQLNGLFFII